MRISYLVLLDEEASWWVAVQAQALSSFYLKHFSYPVLREACPT